VTRFISGSFGAIIHQLERQEIREVRYHTIQPERYLAYTPVASVLQFRHIELRSAQSIILPSLSLARSLSVVIGVHLLHFAVWLVRVSVCVSIVHCAIIWATALSLAQ